MAHLARRAFDVHGNGSQGVSKWLDCVFKFMNVLRPTKFNMLLDDRPEVSSGARSGELAVRSRNCDAQSCLFSFTS